MKYYYICDDSCSPLDIESLSIIEGDCENLKDCDWAAKSPEDLIFALEKVLIKLKMEL